MPTVNGPEVATRLGLTWDSLDATVQAQINAKIADAEAKVMGFLNRELVADTTVLTDLYPEPGYELDDYRAWPQAEVLLDEVYTPTLAVPAASGESGLYDVTFTVGLDVAGDPALAPIRSFIAADAAVGLRQDPAFTAAARSVTSVSADGQSVSYEKITSPDALGAAVSLMSLRRWRRLSAYAPRTGPMTPWPYAPGFGR